MQKHFIFAWTVYCFFLLTGCNKPVGYLYPHAATPDLTGTHSGPGTTIQELKPSLVVAATGCMMCHAQVHSNIVTNFGYGEPYYFSQNTPTVGQGYYGDWGITDPKTSNWSTAQIYGKIIVPKAPTPTKVFPSGTPATLADYLRSAVKQPPGATQKPEVIEYSKVYIGAPTKDQILNAANFHPVPFSSAIKYIKRSPQSAELTGLTEALPLVKNDPLIPVTCDGDVIISNRTLYLNQLKIDTVEGCNIYVAGKSVLIHGYITFYNEHPKRNLQITSSESILMGLGVGSYMHGAAKVEASDQYRLLLENWSATHAYSHQFKTSITANNQKIFQENRYVNGIQDAAQEPWGRNVFYERLLLNAPLIHNRYTGNIKGTLIAEVFLGALGSFKYEFDPVFQTVPILPLLPQKIYLELVQ